jgi:hypothetical protein
MGTDSVLIHYMPLVAVIREDYPLFFYPQNLGNRVNLLAILSHPRGNDVNGCTAPND